MIISNTSSNPENDRRSISTLGDTLLQRGDICAAHFCYVLCQVDFGAYGVINPSKLVLIGANHHRAYSDFLSMDALMLTEIYEYARNLSEPDFVLVELQTFKFELALKMLDYGLVEKTLLYIEQISLHLINHPAKFKPAFVKNVYELGDRLKYHDPVFKDSNEDVASLKWLGDLAQVVQRCETGEIMAQDAPGPIQESTIQEPKYLIPVNVEPETQQHLQWQAEPPVVPNNHQQQDVSNNLGLEQVQLNYSDEKAAPIQYTTTSSYQQQDYWSPPHDQQDYGAQDQQKIEQTGTDKAEISQNTWTYEVSLDLRYEFLT